MSLLDTHIGFVEALRSAGLSVSLAEGLDAIERAGKVGGTTARSCARRTPQRWSSGSRSGSPSTRSSTSTTRGWSAAASAGEARAGRGAGQRHRAHRARRGASARRWPTPLAVGDKRRAGPRRRGGRAVRCDAGPRAGPVQLVGVHRRFSGSRPTELIDRLVAGADGPGHGRRGGRAHRRAPDRRLHPAGRGRRPPPHRRGEGARARRRRRPSGRRSTGSTSPPPAAATWRRCGARSTPSPAGWRRG